MPVTVDYIIVGSGNLFISDTTVDLFGQAGDYVTAPLSTYHVGSTMDGVEVNYEPDLTDIMVDQLKDAAVIFQNGYKIMVRTNLAEATLNNLKIAWGLADTSLTGSTASGSTQRLALPISPDEPKERRLMVTGRAPAATATVNKTRKYCCRRAISVEASAHALKRAEATAFPVSFRILADPTYTNAEYGFIEDQW